MFVPLVRRSLERLSEAAAQPEDTEDARLQQALLLAAACALTVAGLIWGLVYLATDQPRPALIPLLYS